MTISRKKMFCAAAILAGSLASLSTALAGIPKGGLAAITVSNDGKTVYAAGDNRVLYVLDAKDLSVKKRVWLELNPYELILTKDGKTLILHDSSGLLTFLDAKTFKKKKKIKKADFITIAWKAGLIIVSEGTSGRGDKARTKIAAYSMKTGKSVMKAKVKGRIEALSALPDASKIFAITDDFESKTEKKEKPPEDLEGIEKDTFEQQHDGDVSQIITLKKDGSEIGRYTTWFKPGNRALMHATNKVIRVVNSSNENGKFDHAGKQVSLFETESFGHYGYAFSRDGKTLISGGLRKGAITKFDSEDSVEFEMPRMGGWPEYFHGFAIGPKGMIYGGTSAYRLIKLSPDGEVLIKTPIF